MKNSNDTIGNPTRDLRLVAQYSYFWCVQWFCYKITKRLCKTCNSYLYDYSTFPLWHVPYHCSMQNLRYV